MAEPKRASKGGRPRKKLARFVYHVKIRGEVVEVRTTCPEAEIYGPDGKPGTYKFLEWEYLV